MAGGPIYPSSAAPDASGEVFPNVHVGATNSRRIQGLGVADATLLTADRTWFLHFEMPPTSLPTGTCKLRLLGVANATTGNVDFSVLWKSVALGETLDIAAGTLFSEGDLTPVTFAAADAPHELKVTLDADTPVAGETIALNLVALNATTTLAVFSTWLASIIFE